MPIIGGLLLVASLFKKKPSDKSAWGTTDLATGATTGLGNMDGKKFSQENVDATAAALQTTGQWAAMLQQMGATTAGAVKIVIGSRDGFRADTNGDGNWEVQANDAESFFKELFDQITRSATGLDRAFQGMLTSFDGTVEELGQFGAALINIRQYTSADLMGEAIAQIENAGRSSWAIWQAGSQELDNLRFNFDGSLASAQALGNATATMYQQELSLIGQIQGMLDSTGAMFSSSIDAIKMSVMDEEGKYNFLRSQVDSLYVQLQTAIDPTAINNIAGQINALTNQAYGLLDQDQKAGAADGYITYLEDVNALTAERLNASQQQIVDNHKQMASLIEAVMNGVADRMMEAANAQNAAAAAQLAASSRPISVDVNVHQIFSEVGQG
jgi:hypothetical protein